jgi:hypothetical protein
MISLLTPVVVMVRAQFLFRCPHGHLRTFGCQIHCNIALEDGQHQGIHRVCSTHFAEGHCVHAMANRKHSCPLDIATLHMCVWNEKK